MTHFSSEPFRSKVKPVNGLFNRLLSEIQQHFMTFCNWPECWLKPGSILNKFTGKLITVVGLFRFLMFIFWTFYIHCFTNICGPGFSIDPEWGSKHSASLLAFRWLHTAPQGWVKHILLHHQQLQLHHLMTTEQIHSLMKATRCERLYKVLKGQACRPCDENIFLQTTFFRAINEPLSPTQI